MSFTIKITAIAAAADHAPGYLVSVHAQDYKKETSLALVEALQLKSQLIKMPNFFQEGVLLVIPFSPFEELEKALVERKLSFQKLMKGMVKIENINQQQIAELLKSAQLQLTTNPSIQ